MVRQIDIERGREKKRERESGKREVGGQRDRQTDK